MNFFLYIFGPRLYMDYDESNIDLNEMYKLPQTERIGDFILSTLMVLWNICLYISPIIAAFLYRRSNELSETFFRWLKFSAYIVALAFVGICLRAYGRIRSQSYRRLIKALNMTKSPQTAEDGREALNMFDFDFRWWPIDFDVLKLDKNDIGEPAKVVLNPIENKFGISRMPSYVLGYILMNSFGLRMLYPGSIRTLQNYLRPNLVAGRAQLILLKGAKRFKLQTMDGNKIDTVFVDNREKGKNGKTLIIGSEGNLSFYEIGVGNTPVGREFSVLGWNRPGYEGSTGKPYPIQEMNAMDAVIQFAIKELNFDLSDIILYGWSIGGFSTACGASKYNGLKGIILDGTFDDVVELAVLRFPNFFSTVVRTAIRYHCNLNIAELLKKYHGPVLIVRRTYDETIASDNRIETNRTNFLTLKILKYRYPNILQTEQIELLQHILTKPVTKDIITREDEFECTKLLMNYATKYGKGFPILLGDDFTEEQRNRMAKFLLVKHFRDYKSAHCTRLPLEFFQIPWDIPIKVK